MSGTTSIGNAPRNRVGGSPTITSSAPAEEPGSVPAPKLLESNGQTRRALGQDGLRAATIEEQQAVPAGTISAASLQQANDARRAQNKPPYNPTNDSKALYDAMHGGVFGAGTDEAAIFKTLEGKSPDQIAQLKRSYNDHYGRNLEKDLKSELSGTDLSRAQALMKGDRAAADADALNQAIAGAGTDEAAIMKTLDGKSKGELAKIEQQYKARHGERLRDALEGDLSGDALTRANALLDGQKSEADAATIKEAVRGAGTDEATIYQTLQGKSPEERKAIAAAYEKKYGRSLLSDLKGDLSGADYDRAKALLDGDTAKAKAAEIRQAVSGPGTDERAIELALEGRSAEERAAIATAYQKQYGTSLRRDLKNDLGGNDLKKAQTLLEKGQLSDAEKLHYAVDGLGTDEDAIKQVLTNRSKSEINQIRSDYRQRYGVELDKVLKSDLSGRERFDVGQAMKGRPESSEEALARMNERRNFERSGIRNLAGRALMDGLSDKGALLDKNTKRANEYYKQAMADGQLDQTERQRLSTLTNYANQDVDGYREAKDSAAETAGTVAATAGAVAVTIGTAGAGAPLLATTLAAAGTGAAARVTVKGAIDGNAAGWESVTQDALVGGAEGATAVLGAATGAGRGAAKVTLETAAKRSVNKAGLNLTDEAVQFASSNILNQTKNRVARGTVQGAADGLVGGSLMGATSSAIREETWNDGIEAGLGKVAKSTVQGAAAGGVGGAIGGGFAGALKEGPGFSGTNMKSKYAGEETGSVWGSSVKYLSDEERLKHALTIRDGKLYDASGKLFDTTGGSSVFAGGSGNAIFVMGKDGKLYASLEQSVGHFHHSSLLAGKPVATAGEMAVENGVIKSISNRSGHYMPSDEFTRQGLRRLAHEGVDLRQIEMRTWDGSAMTAREFIGAN